MCLLHFRLTVGPLQELLLLTSVTTMRALDPGFEVRC
jgi:hypothetical protein